MRRSGGAVAGGAPSLAGDAAAGEAVDVVVVSLGATGGLRTADRELCDSLRRAGASVVLVPAGRPREVRTLMATDLLWALSARRAAKAAIAKHSPRAVIYSSVTAALLWPREGAIRFDAVAAGNRPGRHGLWQRRLERRRLRAAPLLLPYSGLGPDEVPAGLLSREQVLPLPVPVEPSGDGAALGRDVAAPGGDVAAPGGDVATPDRDVAAIAYGANPTKKGLDRILGAWEAVRKPGETLIVAGAPERELRQAGIALPEEGVQLTGMLDPAEYRALLRRARVFVCAPRREDHGIAQLEALADGCMLVTTPAPGPYVALPIARSLDPRLVSEDLRPALRAALDDPRPDYLARASEALSSLRREAVDRLVAEQVLPRLLGPMREFR